MVNEYCGEYSYFYGEEFFVVFNRVIFATFVELKQIE